MKIPSSIFRNFIILALSAGLVLATQVARHSEAADPAKSDNKYRDLLYGGDFDIDCESGEAEDREAGEEKKADVDEAGEIIEKYHEVINCLFNRRIEVMVKKMLKPDEDGKPLTKEDLQEIFELLSPPAFIFDENRQPIGREECKGADEGEDMNLSTYCIADAAVKEYFEFREAMQEARKLLKDKAAQGKIRLEKEVSEAQEGVHVDVLGLSDVSRVSRAMRNLGTQINRIDREIDIARQALDQGLAAYSELQMSLPLHRKYLEIIGALEEYRDHVRDIRKEVDLYPVTFLDVTTTACT